MEMWGICFRCCCRSYDEKVLFCYSTKAYVDGAQVGLTKYVSLDPGASDTMTFLWIPKTAKGYSVEIV